MDSKVNEHKIDKLIDDLMNELAKLNDEQKEKTLSRMLQRRPELKRLDIDIKKDWEIFYILGLLQVEQTIKQENGK